MKKSILLALFLFVFSLNSMASSLQVECSNFGGRVISNTKITKFSISSINRGNTYGFNVEVPNGTSYSMILIDPLPMIYREEIASTARMAKVLGLSVDLCVQDNVLYGIQL